MAKLIFKYEEGSSFSKSNREANEIEMKIPDDMNIWEFKTIIKRLAASLGYTEDSIERCFEMNDDVYQNSNMNFKNNSGTRNVEDTRQLLTDVFIKGE